MALAAKTESIAHDENYLAPENLALGTLQTPTSKISDKSALSAVSWAAIFSGATAAAALALILLLLGTGLGLSALSPWANNGTWANQDIKCYQLWCNCNFMVNLHTGCGVWHGWLFGWQIKN